MDTTGSEAEHKARLSLSLMLAKLLAMKTHGGWMHMTAGATKTVLNGMPFPAEVHERRKQMEPLFAKGSIIHQVRNWHGGHYPPGLSLKGLEGIAQSDVAFFMTPYSGDTIATISELSAASSLANIAAAGQLHESIDRHWAR
jgi:hypothetical protein